MIHMVYKLSATNLTDTLWYFLQFVYDLVHNISPNSHYDPSGQKKKRKKKVLIVKQLKQPYTHVSKCACTNQRVLILWSVT